MVPQAYLANKISRDSLKQTTFKTILCYSGELAALLNSAFLPCLFFFLRDESGFLAQAPRRYGFF